MRGAALVAWALLAGCGGEPGVTDRDEPDERQAWEILREGERGALMSIWGVSAQDLWFVGGDPDGRGGTVLRRTEAGIHALDPGEPGDLWWVFGFEEGPV